MYKALIAAGAIVFTVGTANAVDDWGGVVKMQAVYDNPDPTVPQLLITADVVYDKAGRRSKAWGTMTYMLREPDASGPAGLRIYAHPLCVGAFSGDKWTVAGKVAQQLGTFTPALEFINFEIDVTNKMLRVGSFSTETLAKASCAQQSGLFVVTFNHGYVIAK